MRKTLLYLIFVLLSLTLLVNVGLASGQKPGVEEESVTLLINSHYIPQTQEVLKDVCAEWGMKNGVDVRIDFVVDTDLESIFTGEGEAGEGHDILAVRDYVSYLFNDILSDVGDIVADVESENGDAILAGKLGCVVDGKWKAVPWYHESNPMVFRKDYIEQVGYTVEDMYDLTMDEFLILAKKLNEIGHPVGIPTLS